MLILKGLSYDSPLSRYKLRGGIYEDITDTNNKVRVHENSINAHIYTTHE